MIQDLRIAARGLLKEPGTTTVLFLTLSIGIGATTALFSVVHAVILRPLPYSVPERLVRVLNRNSYPDMRDWIEQNRTFEGFGGYNAWFLDYRGTESPERIQGAIVTGGLFPLLGVAPALGRILGPEDDVPGGERVALASDEFWRARLGGNSDALGQTVLLNGEPFAIVGVMPRGFRLPSVDAELFLPHLVVSPSTGEARGAHFLISIGRLREGQELPGAQADMDAIARRLEALYPEENTGRRFVLEPWQRALGSDSRPALLLLLGAALVVLAIACSNVAALLLARSARREREIALRRALGATGGRLVRQLLVESVLLGVGGGLLGIAVARALLPALLALAPRDVPRLDEAALHPQVILFALLVSIATGILFGAAPAVHANRLALVASLKDGARSGFGRHRLRTVLIVSEVALAVVLLVGAGLLIRSFHRLTSVDPGFRHQGLVTMDFLLPTPEFREIPKRIAFFEEVLARIGSVPGAVGVAATTDLPFGSGRVPHNLTVEGRDLPEGTEPEIYYRAVSPEYFRVMGIPLLEGRGFTESDREGSLPVAIVNEAFLRLLFPGESPLGRRVRFAREDEIRWMTIVGVASDVKPSGFDAPEVEAIYVPFRQEQRWWRTWMSLAVRTDAPAELVSRPIRRAVSEIHSGVPVANIQPMAELLSRSAEGERFQLVLLGSFAGAALFLAGVGLYGLLSHVVAERRSELGIRLAIGAGPAAILSMVLGRGLQLAVLGLALGSAAAIALSRTFSSFLFEVSPTEPTVYAAIAGVLLAIAALASLLPAYRASRVDPIRSIRYE